MLLPQVAFCGLRLLLNLCALEFLLSSLRGNAWAAGSIRSLFRVILAIWALWAGAFVGSTVNNVARYLELRTHLHGFCQQLLFSVQSRERTEFRRRREFKNSAVLQRILELGSALRGSTLVL